MKHQTFKKILAWIQTRNGYLCIGGGIILLLVIIFAAAAVGSRNRREPAESTQTESVAAAEPETTTPEPETTTPEPETTTPEPETTADPHLGESRSPLTGLYVSDSIAATRPVAIMINNISQALPQSGVLAADVIYEAPVEGGITRLMAIYQNYASLAKLGSVRSSRLYYAQAAVEYDAIYAHFGQSKYAVNFLNSSAIDNLSAMEAVGNTVYFRTSDRVAPHNAYASGDRILKGISQKGYRSTISEDYRCPLVFTEDGEKITLNGGGATRIYPGYASNKPYFVYDSASGTYLRYQYGGAHMDRETGTQLSVTNVIIQFAPAAYQGDEKTWDFTLTGTGSGYCFTGGTMEKISWSRASLTGVTTYYRADGSPLVLNNGKTWVCLVQSSAQNSVSYQ